MEKGKNAFVKVTQERYPIAITYTCKIIDADEHFLYIDQPIHEETKRTLYLKKGTRIQVYSIGNDNGVLQFHSIVVHRKILSIPTYAILPPKQTEMKRIQRRNFVRVQTAIDVAVHCPKNSTTPFTTVTTNISGGGLACILPTYIMLEKNQYVSIFIVLQTKKLTYIEANARVVHIQPLPYGKVIFSLEFMHLKEKDRHAIIQYGFDLERQYLKKY